MCISGEVGDVGDVGDISDAGDVGVPLFFLAECNPVTVVVARGEALFGVNEAICSSTVRGDPGRPLPFFDRAESMSRIAVVLAESFTS